MNIYVSLILSDFLCLYIKYFLFRVLLCITFYLENTYYLHFNVVLEMFQFETFKFCHAFLRFKNDTQQYSKRDLKAAILNLITLQKLQMSKRR